VAQIGKRIPKISVEEISDVTFGKALTVILQQTRRESMPPRHPSHRVRRYIFGAASIAIASVGTVCAAQAPSASDWQYHGGDAVDRFSPLDQVTPANVAQLKEAWRFPMEAGGLESQPIKIGDTVYLVTTTRTLVAVDAASGAQKWVFDPGIKGTQPVRGIAVWKDSGKLRILLGRESFLYEIDAATGTPVTGFGDGGRIDLRIGLRGKPEDNAIYITSPAIVYRGTIIVNGRVAENTKASPGDVRAFDARTGKPKWTFHTIPHPGEVGADTWPKDAYLTQGGANAWSGASVDNSRGIVFVNTGSPADDFYGAERLGDNRMANSTIAIDALTGKRIWDFQQVHHDLWDSDSTSPPLLTTIKRNGRKIDVAVAWNKAAYVYVLDRRTGKPIFPTPETPVPASNVPGEVASKTQPIPSLPRPLVRKVIAESELTRASPDLNAQARTEFAKLYNPGQPFTPLGLNQNTLVIPGFAGAWGGMAADHDGVIYATAMNGAGMSKIVDNSKARELIGEPGAPPPFGGLQNGYQRLAYGFSGYGQFRLPGGQSALDPSATQATLNAIDINTGEYRWSIPLPGRNGSSGPLVTASKLLFIVASNKLQAYSSANGHKIWETQLPGSGGNGAGTYMQNGKQYIIVASGGTPSPSYVAYALP
jgi:quinoprotein glucose dehydrogenase